MLNLNSKPKVHEFIVLPVDLDFYLYADTQLEISFGTEEVVNTVELFVRKEYTDTSFDHHFGTCNQYDEALDYTINSTDGFSEQFVNYLINNIELDVLKFIS